MSSIERSYGSADPGPTTFRRRYVSEFVKALFETRIAVYSNFAASLARVIDLPVEQVDQGELDAFFVLKHLDFLLKQGEPLCSTCEFRLSSYLYNVLELVHYRWYQRSVQKVFTIISDAPLNVDVFAFHQANSGPSVQVRLNTVTVDLDGGEIGISIPDVFLTEKELLNLLRNKQNSQTRQESFLRIDSEARSLAAIEELKLIRQSMTRCRRTIGGSGKGERHSHPYQAPQLLVLPRLLNQCDGTSPLRMIAHSLERIRDCGFDGVMLSPVDVQTVHTYFAETIDGRFVAHVNNHGYWSSGAVGIDESIGNEDDYRVLIARASELGMRFTQDCTFATLGYMPQIPRLAIDPGQPLNRLYLGGKASDGCDGRLFTQEVGLKEETALGEELSSSHYEDLMALVHRGSLYHLPRPDLFQDEVREDVMDRALWLVARGGVRSFRIDMAKHIGVRQLRSVIADLRAAVGDLSKGAHSFSAVLEYWTTRYRDLRFGIESLGDEASGVYFLDFPLASAIYSLLIDQADLCGTLQRLQWERARCGIDIRRLVPTFIDHDGVFRPIYNGTEQSRSLTVVGFVVALMMSANGPNVYFQFADSRCGVEHLSNFSAYSEKHSRRRAQGILDDNDPQSPLDPIAKLFGAFRRGRFVEDWDGNDIAVNGNSGQVVISRHFRSSSGAAGLVTAVVSRAAHAHKISGQSEMIFEYGGAMTTQIFASFARNRTTN